MSLFARASFAPFRGWLIGNWDPRLCAAGEDLSPSGLSSHTHRLRLAAMRGGQSGRSRLSLQDTGGKDRRRPQLVANTITASELSRIYFLFTKQP
jgi:hypothetical protein